MTLLDLYLSLPWTITSSQRVDDGEPYAVLTIKELDFVVAAPEVEIEDRFWSGLALLLESYIDDNEVPPVPASVDRELLTQFIAGMAPLVRAQPGTQMKEDVSTGSISAIFAPTESRKMAGAAA